MEDRAYNNYTEYLTAYYHTYFMTRYLALSRLSEDIYVEGEDSSLEIAVQTMIETYHPEFLTPPKPIIIIGV